MSGALIEVGIYYLIFMHFLSRSDVYFRYDYDIVVADWPYFSFIRDT